MIKVGVDLTDLKYAETGQKTYLASISNEFKKIRDPEFKFIFFATPFQHYKSKKKFLILFNHFLLQVWKQIILPIKLYLNKCDIIFCTDYYVPIWHFNFKSVQVIHDTFFSEYPNHYNKYWLKIYRIFSLPGTYKSTYIIAPSEYSKKQIIKYLKIPPSKIEIVYEGSKNFNDDNISNTNNAFVHKNQTFPYFLHVGVFEKRKNIPFLIKSFYAFKKRNDNNFKLMIVGRGTGRLESDDTNNILNLITDLQLQNDIILTGYLSDSDLEIAYRNAYAYIFPSYNEGFGLPITEAFQFNIPVLVANNTCLLEVGGDAVLSFDPYNQNDLVNQIEQICNNTLLRNNLIQQGQQRLMFFDWEKTAKSLLEVFIKTIQKN